MAESKKVTLSADGATATVADAEVGDIFTTVLDSDTAITGTYGYLQKAGLVIAGMAVQNNRVKGSWNPFT